MAAILALIGAASFVLADAPPGAPAPLPPGFASEHSEEDEADYRPLPDQKGIFAHGFIDDWRLPLDGETPCLGTAEEQAAVLAKLRAEGRSQFWFYATRSQAILFTRTITIEGDKPCRAAMRPRYDVERAFLVDGRIHSFSVDDRGRMEPLASLPDDRIAAPYSGSFGDIQSLFARNPQVPGRRRETDTIAGTAVVCGGSSGLVWYRNCVVQTGSAKGMMLSERSGDDEGNDFAGEVRELRVGTVLPGKLFEVERRWRGAE